MAATAVRPAALIPAPRAAGDDAPPAEHPSLHDGSTCRAVAYQRVVHRLVRRELRLLADLATWAPDDEAERTAALTRHADLARQGADAPPHRRARRGLAGTAAHRAGRALDEVRGARRVHRPLRTDRPHAARRRHGRPAVGCRRHVPVRGAFASACRELADAVDAQTDDEERTLLPLLESAPTSPRTGRRSRVGAPPAHTREQLLVLGWRWRTPAPGTGRDCSTGCPPPPVRPGASTGDGTTGRPSSGCGVSPRRADPASVAGGAALRAALAQAGRAAVAVLADPGGPLARRPFLRAGAHGCFPLRRSVVLDSRKCG